MRAKHARVPWTLVQADGTGDERVDLAAVQACLDRGEHFWLDLGHPESAELEALSDLLDLHPLVRDDLGVFAQRAKADDYPTHTFLVLPERRTTQTARSRCMSWSPEKWLVTVHTETIRRSSACASGRCEGAAPSTAMLTQRIADSLADSFYPELEQLDERVDALERLGVAQRAHDVRPRC